MTEPLEATHHGASQAITDIQTRYKPLWSLTLISHTRFKSLSERCVTTGVGAKTDWKVQLSKTRVGDLYTEKHALCFPSKHIHVCIQFYSLHQHNASLVACGGTERVRAPVCVSRLLISCHAPPLQPELEPRVAGSLCPARAGAPKDLPNRGHEVMALIRK